MRLFLVRHGEAQDDVEDCYGGIADFELSDVGRDTARQLGEQLQGRGIARVYTSPYKRAHETAKIVAQCLGCEVRVIDDLCERNSYGVLSGVNKDRAKNIFARVIEQLEGKPGDFYSDEVLLGAEPLSEFNTRVQSAFEHVATDASDCEAVCVVTHGNVTRSVYKKILGVEGKVGLDLLAMTEMNWNSGKPDVVSSSGVSVKS